MSKELEVLQKLRDLVEYLTRIDYVPTELRNEVKELLIKSYKDSNGYFSQIEQALNELEDAKHNYKAIEEMYNNVVAYAVKIQEELDELNKRNEPMKPKYGGKFPECPVCRNLLHSIWQKHCDNCTQAIDWSNDEK